MLRHVVAVLAVLALAGPVLADPPDQAGAPAATTTGSGTPALQPVTVPPPPPRPPRRYCVDEVGTGSVINSRRVCFSEDEWRARQQRQRATASQMGSCMDDTAGCRVNEAAPLSR